MSQNDFPESELFIPIVTYAWGEVVDDTPPPPSDGVLGTGFLPYFNSLNRIRAHWPDAAVIAINLETGTLRLLIPSDVKGVAA